MLNIFSELKIKVSVRKSVSIGLNIVNNVRKNGSYP